MPELWARLRLPITGGLEEIFISDRFKPTSWLTLIAGFRQSHFTADLSRENAVDPRVGIAVQIPRLELGLPRVLGPLLSGSAALDRHWPVARFGEQPECRVRAAAGRARYRISIRRHYSLSRLGAGRGSLPNNAHRIGSITATSANRISSGRSLGTGALIQAWELTLRSPRLWRFGQFHLAYANQIAQASGPFTGGLICPQPVDPLTCPVVCAAGICTCGS